MTLRAAPCPARRGRAGSRARGRGEAFPLADSEFDEFLQISVTDNGIGMSPEGLERLFKPFSQIDSGLARKYEGTGLGLAMVKLLAELHGGTVAVESAVGEGSCFTVWLPLRAAAEAGASVAEVRASGVAPVERRGSAGTALVVEDDFKSAELIRVQLEAEGFVVLHAASAEAGAGARGATAAVAHHAGHPAAQHERLGVPRSPQTGPRARRASRWSSSRSWQIATRVRPRRRGGHAEADLPAGALRVAGGAGTDPAPQGRKLKVLVVDDDPKAVELVAVRILGLGGGVLRAYGGREAIETARQERPDLIVLDLMMPDVNGFDVVNALNSEPGTAHIPILVVTAKEITAEDRAKLKDYVMNIVEKSTFDGDRFTAEVRRAMSGPPGGRLTWRRSWSSKTTPPT